MKMHEVDAAQKKLAVRMPNWVGDAIMALPALDGLAQQGFELSLYGKPWLRTLFAAYPHAIHVMPQEFRQARSLCKQSESDYFLLLTNSISSAARIFFAGKKAIGYPTDIRRFLLKHAVPKPSHLHEVESFWNLAQYTCREVFGKRWDMRLPEILELQLSSTVKHAVETQIRALKLSSFIVLCPGAVGRGEEAQSKIWPHWRELALKLIHLGVTVVACPGPGEEILFRQLLPPEVIFIDELPLDAYAALMAKACGVVANDSGPMHLACATNASVLGVFGTTEPRRTKPWGGEFAGNNRDWPTVGVCIDWVKTKIENKG